MADIRPVVSRPAPLDLTLPSDEQAAASVQRARGQLQRGQHAGTIPILEQALRRAPDSVAVQRELGLAHLAAGDDAAAAEYLRAAAGDDVQVQQALGRIAAAAGDLDVASLRYRTALACSGADTTDAAAADMVRLLLSEVLLEQGYLTASLEALQQLERNLYRRDYGDVGGTLGALTESPELVSIRQGRLLLELRRYDEAVAAADTAYRLNKAYAPGCQLFAEALAKSRRFDRAEHVGLEMLGGTVNPGILLEVLLTVYRAKGDTAGPARLLAAYKVRQGAPPTPVLLVLAWATRTLGDNDAALKMLADHVDSVDDPVAVALTYADWLIAEGRIAEGLEAFARLLVHDPGAFRRIRSRIHWTPHRYFDAAVIDALVAAAADDTSPARHVRLYLTGVVLARIGQDDRAAGQFRGAIEAHKSFVPAYETLVELLLAQRRFDEASAVAEQARQAGLTLTADFIIGRIHLARDEIDEAVDLLSRVSNSDPTHVSSRVSLAQAHLRRGRLTVASQALQEAVFQTRDMEALGLLLQLHLAQYQQELRKTDTTAARTTLEQIRKTITDLVRQEPTDPRALWMLGRVLAQHHQYAEARAAVDRLMTLTPDNARARLLKVRVDVRAPVEDVGPRRFATAMADLDAAALAEPEDPSIWILKADVLEGRHRYDEAADALAKAMDLGPEQATLAMRMAAALRKAGRPGPAADALAELAASDRSAQILHAILLSQTDRADEAIQLLRERIAGGDSGPLSSMVLMHALVSAGQADEALIAAEAAITEDTGDERTDLLQRALKIGLLYRAGRHGEMVEFAGQWFNSQDASDWLKRIDDGQGVSDIIVVLTANDFTPSERRRWSPVVRAATPVHLAAGWLLTADRDAEAVDLVLHCIDELDADDDTQAKLASAMRAALLQQLLTSGKLDAARRIYASLLAADGENVELLASAASVYSRPTRADRKRRDALLNRALELNGDDAQLKNNIAYDWADRGVNLREAQRLLNEAIEVDSRSHIQDSLAWVHYKKGELRPALSLLQQAINSPGGDNFVMYDHAGDVYWRLGRRAQAVAMWTEAADLAEAQLDAWGDLADDETRRVMRDTPSKIEAAQSGRRPRVAPLGTSVRP